MITRESCLNLILALTLAMPTLASAQHHGQNIAGIFSGSTDVGVTLKGASTYDRATKTYRVTGGGADLWGAADAFHFDWVRMSGDAALTADIHFPPSAAKGEKAILIFRQSLDPASPYADVAIHGDGHITLQFRNVQGGKTADITAADHGAIRLRIERNGNQFTAYTGPTNGKLTAFSSTTVELKDPVYVGIGVCAHDAARVVTVSFSHVTIEKQAHRESSR
jgi:hypothetical protein